MTKAIEFPVTVELDGKYTRGMMVIDRNTATRQDSIIHHQTGTAWMPIKIDIKKIMGLKSLRFD